MDDRDKSSLGNGQGRPRDSSANGGGGRRTGNGGENGRNQRARNSAARYRRKVEERLFGKKADRGRLRLEERLREADEPEALLRTFREYLRAHGMPGDVGLLVRLLDLPSESDVLQVTDEIDRVAPSLSAEQKSLLRSRLRNLEMATSSDAIADAAAEILERL